MFKIFDKVRLKDLKGREDLIGEIKFKGPYGKLLVRWGKMEDDEGYSGVYKEEDLIHDRQ